MFRTQKKYEETILVRNEQEPVWASGGISQIPVESSVSIRAVMLPDERMYKQKEDGFVLQEKMFAQVRKTEMEKADMIPGKTKITWNGETWRVTGIVDYRLKDKFQNAEIALVKHVGLTGNTAW